MDHGRYNRDNPLIPGGHGIPADTFVAAGERTAVRTLIARLVTSVNQVIATQEVHTEAHHHLRTTQDEHAEMLRHQSMRLQALEEVLARTLVERVEGDDIEQQSQA